ncbi:uncharacterized protein LOC135399298 [Ornithodoros turicata]|uniref:uncharacterized protein LOC135399298 n=1 Tax=Ornithodoros turicata TaxID=34597 RepID=UPI003139D258
MYTLATCLLFLTGAVSYQHWTAQLRLHPQTCGHGTIFVPDLVEQCGFRLLRGLGRLYKTMEPKDADTNIDIVKNGTDACIKGFFECTDIDSFLSLRPCLRDVEEKLTSPDMKDLFASFTDCMGIFSMATDSHYLL